MMREDSPNLPAFQIASFYSIAFFSLSMRCIFQVLCALTKWNAQTYFLGGTWKICMETEKRAFLKIPQIQTETPVFPKVAGRLIYFGDKDRYISTENLLQDLVYKWQKQSPEVCSMQKDVLWYFTKFTEKHLFLSLFLNNVSGLRHSCFLVNFVKFLITPFLKEHLWWLLLYITYNENSSWTWQKPIHSDVKRWNMKTILYSNRITNS